jgi:dTDP-4-dehydrorhamnose reductase
MKLIVTGANGQVGHELVRRAEADGHDVIALNRSALDIRDPQAVERALSVEDLGVVINAAAYTAVDKAEDEPEAAFATNRDGAANLAMGCAHRGLPLLHISTDYVFDGSQLSAYKEDDLAAPISVYGQSKWQGEEAVRRFSNEHIILRVSWIFGAHGQNFVKTMLRLAREREVLRVVSDQRGCPTYAGDIAAVLLELSARVAHRRIRGAETGDSQWGTYHYGGTPQTTWYEFARTIVDIARDLGPLTVREVVPIATLDFPTAARRPANTVLDCVRIEERLGIHPRPWRDGLQSVLEELQS